MAPGTRPTLSKGSNTKAYWRQSAEHIVCARGLLWLASEYTKSKEAIKAAPVGVAPEDVCNDHHSFLDYIADLLLDKIQQHIDAALCCPLKGHCAASNCPNSLHMARKY